MRKLLAALLAFATISYAQPPAQPPVPSTIPSSNWQHVQALPVGAFLKVNAKTRYKTCKLKSDDADTLTCTDAGQDFVFQRSEIKTIKIPRRGRAALIDMAIGASAGAIIGASLGRSGSFIGHGAGAVIVAIPGALIGAIVGAATGSPASTVYKTP